MDRPAVAPDATWTATSGGFAYARRMDDDCDLDALKEAVLDAVRARSEHKRKLLHSSPSAPVDAEAWQAEAQRLEDAYRRAQDEWEECVSDREDARRYGLE